MRRFWLGLALLLLPQLGVVAQGEKQIGGLDVDGVIVAAYANVRGADGAGSRECVEFARRVIRQLGGELPRLGANVGAVAIWEQSARWPGFERLENGSGRPIEPYDLVVYADGGYGHVAVSAGMIAEGQMRLVEQNWSDTTGEAVVPFTEKSGRYWLAPRRSRDRVFNPLGRVRYVGNPWEDVHGVKLGDPRVSVGAHGSAVTVRIGVSQPEGVRISASGVGQLEITCGSQRFSIDLDTAVVMRVSPDQPVLARCVLTDASLGGGLSVQRRQKSKTAFDVRIEK